MAVIEMLMTSTTTPKCEGDMHYGPSRSKPIGTTSNAVVPWLNVWPDLIVAVFFFSLLFFSETWHLRFAIDTMFVMYVYHIKRWR